MAIELPPLPYDLDALEPHMSRETLELHHGKHHQAYVDAANDLLDGTGDEDAPLERLVTTTDGKLFDQVAQAWNHAFFWESLSPEGGGAPSGEVVDAIGSAFGGYDAFRDEFAVAASGHFGSGWAWLVDDGSGLSVVTTHDADNPLTHSQRPLLTLDVWEHAYYLDHRNQRPAYIETFLAHLVSWDHVAAQLA